MENDPNVTDESAESDPDFTGESADDSSKFEDGSEEDWSDLFMDEANEGANNITQRNENDDWMREFNVGSVDGNESEYADSDHLVTPYNLDEEAPKRRKKALKEYSIQHGFDYIFMKNDKWRVTTLCARHYGWRIHASPTQDKAAFQIKSFISIHNCGKRSVITRVDSKWLAHKYLDHLRDTPDWDVDHVVAFKKQVHRDHNVDVSKGRCYKAKRIAYNILQGTHDEQYRQLWDYCAAVMKCNSGSTLLLSCPNSIFENLYECLEAYKKGFKAGCRPSECRASWTWFLTLLQDDIGSAHDNGWIFMSDRQKGLDKTFAQEFPGVHHSYCVRHIATTQIRFNYWMDEIKKIDIQAFHWINQHDPILGSKHTFNPNVKCHIIVNNIVETFNSWILEAWDKPILTVMEIIRRKLMKRFQTKRDGMSASQIQICPGIQNKLEKAKKDSNNCCVQWPGGTLYEVDHCYDGRLVVDVGMRRCGCTKWDLTGIPCSHACDAIFHRQHYPEDYVHEYFKR
ncbi:uncharacterized protein LOC120012476 [Tripterygium wilfordii]|uniref:uncharacterized protein LOC120012476 n=1 Tax=Tripterygium wilfordii TaxID=458696 RepID=UPI0018F7F2E8|nr:uncharacterized protein LOC120012476 [Tripterygium wilfordii]